MNDTNEEYVGTLKENTLGRISNSRGEVEIFYLHLLKSNSMALVRICNVVFWLLSDNERYSKFAFAGPLLVRQLPMYRTFVLTQNEWTLPQSICP